MSQTLDTALRKVDALYETALRPKIDALEHPRRQVRWLISKGVLIVVPAIVILIAGDLLDNVLPIGWSGTVTVAAWVWLVVGAIVAVAKYLLPGIAAYANYRSRFKQDIVAEIFKVVCPYAVYDPLQGITEAVFDAPGLFSTRGGFESDDRVRGRFGDTAFEASEVGRSYSTGGKNSHSYTVFRGLFFHLDSNRQVNGSVLIEPAKARSHQIGDRGGVSQVHLSDEAFENMFKVYASNEAEARKLLTPEARANLLTLGEEAGRSVFVAFKGRRVYVGVNYEEKLFEPGIAASLSQERVRQMASHFALVETVVGELGLNERAGALEPDDSILRGAGIDVDPLTKLAATKGGTMTPEEVWSMAKASIDDSAKDGDHPAPMPAGTRIRVERVGNSLSIS